MEFLQTQTKKDNDIPLTDGCLSPVAVLLFVYAVKDIPSRLFLMQQFTANIEQ
jgi:hypothetical protein